MSRSSLLLSYDFPPMGGGIARALGEIARHAGGALGVSTGRQPGWEAADAGLGVPIDRLPVPSERLRTVPGLVRWGLRADALVRTRRPGFLWAGNVKPAGHVVRWLAARHGLPYGLLVYGLDLALLAAQAGRSRRRRQAIARILGEAAGTVAISRWTRDRYVELAESLGQGGAAGRVRVVPLGVDARRFHPGAATAAFRARHGLEGRRWLLTVARLVPHKGIDTALDLLERLRTAGLDMGYLVAGEGPDRARLEREVAARALRGHVRFLGLVPEADLPALYASAELYLGFSRPAGAEVEGFGLAFLEAQASGVPVLAGRGGGTADAVHDGVTGHLVEPGDRAAVLHAALDLLGDAERRSAFGAAGREWMVRDFGWERVVADLEQAAGAFSAPRAPRAGR